MAKDEKIICSEDERGSVELASNRGPSVRVLAVDDEHSARKLLSVILGQSAFGCTTVNGGEEALEYLRSERFDAVISDLQMPGMGGLGLMRHLAESDTRIPVIIVTAHGDDDMRQRTLQVGAIAFLEKPVRGPALLEAIRSAIGAA